MTTTTYCSIIIAHWKPTQHDDDDDADDEIRLSASSFVCLYMQLCLTVSLLICHYISSFSHCHTDCVCLFGWSSLPLFNPFASAHMSVCPSLSNCRLLSSIGPFIPFFSAPILAITLGV